MNSPYSYKFMFVFLRNKNMHLFILLLFICWFIFIYWFIFCIISLYFNACLYICKERRCIYSFCIYWYLFINSAFYIFISPMVFNKKKLDVYLLCFALQVQYRSTPLVARGRDVTGSAALCVRFLNSSAKRLRFHRFLMFVFCSFVFLSWRMSRWCDVDVFLRALVWGLDYSRCFRGFVMKRWRSGENLVHKTSCFCFVFDHISFLYAFIVCGGVL